MVVENANIKDVTLLTELRLEYLKEDHGKLSKSDIEIIRRDLPDYFKKNLNQNIFCYLIREKEEIDRLCLFAGGRKTNESGIYNRLNRNSFECIYKTSISA